MNAPAPPIHWQSQLQALSQIPDVDLTLTLLLQSFDDILNATDIEFASQLNIYNHSQEIPMLYTTSVPVGDKVVKKLPLVHAVEAIRLLKLLKPCPGG